MGQTVILKDISVLLIIASNCWEDFEGEGTQTQIIDICDVNMEESCKFPVFCAEAQMLQAGLAPEGRAALGEGCSQSGGFIFSVCSTNSFLLPIGKRLLADTLHCPSERTGFLITCYV